MPTKAALLAIAFLVVTLPWVLWRVRAVRWVAPLAVVQILVGVALGPSLLGRVAPDLHAALFNRPVLSALDGVASIGVLLFVLIAGLHLDAKAVQRDSSGFGMVALGSVLVPLVLGAAAGWWMLRAVPGAIGPSGSAFAFVASVAICVAVTALPVLAAILQEVGLLKTRLGQTALALAALNDAALWVMLAGLLALAGLGGGAVHLMGAVAWFGALIALAPRWLTRLPQASETAVLVGVVALAILSAFVSEALGTGYLIGAFAAGIVVPSAWRPALLDRLEMVTATVLLPFFFMATGLKALIEPGSASFLGLTAAATAATVLGKILGTGLPARRLGFSWADCLSLGAMMQTKGLMEVVVLSVLLDAGLIGGQVFSAMVAMAVICTVITAPVIRACRGANALVSMTPP